ncbi:MAG: helix-turn-helix domain-containing protein [Candidatus Veblenbacteria bacterium]|nr:helix-turn-helix domain-containing protein [Candidatus Veblenbacteria bacterium]MDZ4229615.1 helix-turn-helix domain-containing protein [Candidatus Veblenbacteria bacterium]
MRTTELERWFRVLGNRKRLDILRLLERRKSLSVTDVALGIKLSLKSTHKHLHQLLQTGFLDKERKQFNVHYRLADELTPLHRYLLQPVLKS